MNITKAMLWSGLALAFLVTGCRSRQEAAGDKYRKAGDPLHSLMQYEEAIKRGKVSKEFPKNYTLVNIQAMALRAKEDPTAEFLDILKDTVASLLTQNPDPVNEALFSQTLQDIGLARLKLGSAEAAESGFRFLQMAETLGGKSPSVSGKVAGMRKDFVNTKLKEVENDLKEASTTPTAGIVADYKMNKLALMMGGETPEMKDVWSRVRKLNLNTYLMYDNDEVDLGERPDARINKYGVLLGIVKLEPGATTTKIQVKAFNGSSGPIHFDSEGFTLVDRQGNVFKPTAKIGHFSPKDQVGKGDESKTGGLTFTYPAGTEPYFLEFKNEAGVTRKYLP
jgi:hypothetical protein